MKLKTLGTKNGMFLVYKRVRDLWQERERKEGEKEEDKKWRGEREGQKR